MQALHCKVPRRVARYDTDSDINTSLISYHTIWAWHYQVKIDITKRVIRFKTCKLPYHMIYNILKIQGQVRFQTNFRFQELKTYATNDAH